MTAALLNQLRERVRDPDPAVSGAARLDLVELAAGLSRGAWHLWRARRSADPATRLRALASDARRGPRQFQSAIDALLSAGTENVAVPPDVLLTVLGAAPRLRDHRHDTVQRTTLVRLATEGYWRGRALDALADYHLANGEVTEAVFVLAPALDAVGDVPAERQISLLRLAAIQSRRRAAKGWDAERDGMDDIEGRALVAAMALPGPHAAAAARRLAALRTAQGSFYDAERLWAHARELRVRAPESAGSGWIDSYKSLTNVGDGSYTWKRDDSLPVEDDAIPEGRDWGLVGEPGDTLVRREVTMPSSGRRAGCLLLDRVATPGHPVVLLDSWDKAIEVSMWEADVAARWWASFQSEARLCLPPSIDSSTPVTEHGRSRRIEPEIEVLMLDVAVRADCAVPADISKALGWARKLVWAIFALQRALEPQPGMPSQYEARDYLQNVALGAGGAVMAVLRPSNGGRPAPLDVARLIDCFWRLELSLLDNAERASYATVMDRARTYLIAERTTVGPDSTRPEAMVGADGDSDMAPFTIVARAQARAAAAVERAREGTRPRGFDNTLRNAADAARGLESGAAFTAFPELIDAEVLELIERVAVLIPPRARDLRAQLPEDATQKSRPEFNALVNGADVLRLLATLQRTSGESAAALDRLLISRAYYAEAAKFAGTGPYQQAMVSRRWATANTLIASLAADGDPRLATQMADEALRLADRLVRLDLKGEGRLADVSALRVRALMVGRWAQGTSEPSALELAERDGLTTRRSLENVINWCLEHDDYGEALALFDRVEASGSTLSDWAAYRSSVIAAEWAEREPEQTLTAIDRATDLIRIQPHNLTAAGRLLELISRSPPQDVAAWLKRLDLFGLYLADGQGGRGLDAIAAFCAISDRGSDATVDLSAFAAAIVGVAIDGTGTPDEWRKPGPVRVAATQLVPAVALALERYGDGSRILRAPPRLLCAILDISFDLETWARAARLTLRYRDRALADRVIGYLDAERTLVPYLATLAARLELLAGNAEAAYARLALVDSRVRRGGGDVHPAVLDLQARSAIQLGRPEDARAIYERALARQPLNSRMWFGLGQTFRESAEQPGACRAWLSALRTASIDTRGRALGLLTARAIGRISTEADSVVIDEMLAEALANSPRAAISLLAVGLRDAGRPRRAVIDAVLQMPATDRATDSRLGQLLMSSLIWETIAPETASNPHDLLLGAQRLADWGMARDVFGEIVAGARGSYASAAIERLVIPHGRAALVSLVHGGGLRIAARPAPAAFVRSIVDAERGDRDYYLKAGFAFRQLNANAKLAASLALAIIGRIGASYIEKDMPAPVGLLARHTPAITLDRLFAASGWVDEGPAALTPTAFFDRTTMLVLETIAPATHWLSSLDTFERTIADSPAVDEISVLLSRGGVNVRRDSGVVVCSVSRSATFA